MHELAGKKVGIVEFSCKGGRLTGCVKSCGVTAEYAVESVVLKKPVEAILMDLDGTTLTSEAFWIFIIETTVQKLLGNKKFSLEDADIPFVSGFTTVEHLRYCIAKYAPDMLLETALRIYHETAEKELDKIMKGEGRIDAFKPAEGLKEFLLGVKSCGIKIGLATSGLDYKAIPEIVAAFRTLRMGDPLAFYDSVITGGRRKDVGGYGSLGEIVSKPHPWLYTELAYMGLKITDPSRAVGIEDSAAGVMALRFAGFPVYGMQDGNISTSGLDGLCLKKAASLADIYKEIVV